MSTLVPTDPRPDQECLDIIRTVIATASRAPSQDTVVIPSGSALALLRVRHAAYRDGRARNAISRSVSANHALLTHHEKLNTPDNYGASYIQQRETLPQTVSNFDIVAKVLAASTCILTACLGFFVFITLAGSQRQHRRNCRNIPCNYWRLVSGCPCGLVACVFRKYCDYRAVETKTAVDCRWSLQLN